MLLILLAAIFPISISANSPVSCTPFTISTTERTCDYTFSLTSEIAGVYNDPTCGQIQNVARGRSKLTFTSTWATPVSYSCESSSNTKTLSRAQAMAIITLDGYSRPIVTYNGRFPGPILKLTENPSTNQTQARIKIRNMNTRESTTLSLSRLSLKNAAFMSGVPSISQCPIDPSEEFSYRFSMNPTGVHLYESLQDGQGGDGASGVAFLQNSGSPAMGTVIEIADWYPYDTQTLMGSAPFSWSDLSITNAAYQTGGFYMDASTYLSSSFYPDSTGAGYIPWWSILVGGRGYLDSTKYGPVRLYKSTGAAGTKVTFHFVHTGIEKPINIDIPDHKLTVMKKDGVSLKTSMQVDTLWIMPGESWDVNVTLGSTGGNFPIRARGGAFSVSANGVSNQMKIPMSFAVFSYGLSVNQTEGYPSISMLNKTSGNDNLNCPFTSYDLTNNMNIKCIPVGSLTGQDLSATTTLKPSNVTVPSITNPSNVTKVLSLGMQKGIPNINGFRMSSLSAPVLLNPDATKSSVCSGYCSTFGNEGNGSCACRHQMNVTYNSVVTLLLTNFGQQIDGNTAGYTQTFTIQGYTFYLLYQSGSAPCGLSSSYKLNPCPANSTTYVNENFTCAATDPYCLNPQPKNLAAIERDYNLVNPLEVNVVSVPLGQYVAIRFVANNPGAWLGRSTNRISYAKGMSIILDVAAPANQRLVIPSNIPQCNAFVNNTAAYTVVTISPPTPAPTVAIVECIDPKRMNWIWWLVGSLGGNILVGIGAWVYVKFLSVEATRRKPRQQVAAEMAAGSEMTKRLASLDEDVDDDRLP